MKKFLSAAVPLFLVVIAGRTSAAAPTSFSFILPYDAEVVLTPSGGSGAASTEFGLGVSQATAAPLFTNLPHSIFLGKDIGFYPAGSALDVYMKTLWTGNTYWAFSDDATSTASITAYTDTDNILHMAGSVYEKVSNTQYVMHLDDAASYTVDDNDHDVLMTINLTPVPEPASLALLGISGAALFMRRHPTH